MLLPRTRLHMQISLDNLTAKEYTDWEYFLTWYTDNGRVGDEARTLAWTDLQRKYKRLQEFSGIAQP